MTTRDVDHASSPRAPTAAPIRPRPSASPLSRIRGLVLPCRPMLFTADVFMGVLVVLLVARGLWDLFRE